MSVTPEQKAALDEIVNSSKSTTEKLADLKAYAFQFSIENAGANGALFWSKSSVFNQANRDVFSVEHNLSAIYNTDRGKLMNSSEFTEALEDILSIDYAKGSQAFNNARYLYEDAANGVSLWSSSSAEFATNVKGHVITFTEPRSNMPMDLRRHVFPPSFPTRRVTRCDFPKS